MATAKKKLTKRQQQSRKINRERANKKWMKNIGRRVAITLSVMTALYVAGMGAWCWHTGRIEAAAQLVSDRFYAMTAHMGFGVQEIFLDGRKTTSMQEVVSVLGVNMGDPIFKTSVDELRTRLEELPSVHYAEVDRELPGTLHIQIMERVPVAVWQHKGRQRLLDADGVVMEKAILADYPNLPVIVGQDAPSHMRELYAFLIREPDLFRQVVSAVRVGDRRWNLQFKNGVEAKLPEDAPDAAWSQLARMQREQKLLARDISSIDLRLKDRVFIKLNPAASGEAKTPPKET